MNHFLSIFVFTFALTVVASAQIDQTGATNYTDGPGSFTGSTWEQFQNNTGQTVNLQIKVVSNLNTSWMALQGDPGVPTADNIAPGATFWLATYSYGPGGNGTYSEERSITGYSVVATNHAPTISWNSTQGTVGDGQTYTVSAHGHDSDGNLAQVNVWKNGQPFAFAGGGNGSDGDSGNATSDNGPTTVTFTAQAVDSSGATSATISQTVTVNAPAPVNHAPTISWNTSPGNVADGQTYTISAHGHDQDGNLAQVNVWKNGQPFAFAGGGNGTDGDSGNPTSDSGPTTVTFTAQAVDASGATSATMSQSVTVNAPAPVNHAPTVSWNTSPGTVASGQSYTISAHGHDQDGNLTQVNVWKNGQPFAFAGGGNGTDGDSGNSTSDTGPTTATFTAQTVDASGATSATISQTVTVNAPPPVNHAPTIAWTATPGTVASGQAYTISAHGHDQDGDLTQINIWKNGQPFAFAGGGNGSDGDSSNPTSDTGPTTVTFTANAVDSHGATASTISQTVTVSAPPSVSASISVSPTSAGSPGSTTVTWSSANASSVSVTGSGLNSSATSGSQTVTGLAAGTYNFVITAQGYGGPVTRTATFTVTAGPSVSASISASPTSCTALGSSTISWNSSNATSLTVNGTGLNSTAASGSQTVSGLAAGTYNYTVTAQGPNGPATQTATVVVSAAPPNVSGSISASPTSATAPGSTTISWTTANATAVAVSGPGLSNTAASGSQLISGLAAGTYTYTLTAQGSGGPISSSATVTVNAPAPTVDGSISATPTSANAPGATTISWTTTNATSVSVGGNGLVSSASSGSQTVSGLAAGTYTYMLTAQGNGGPVTRTATFTVNAGPNVSGSISVSPSSMNWGGTAMLTWSTTNATSVSVSGNGITGSPYQNYSSLTVYVGGVPPGQNTWTLVANGPGGPITRTATIQVNTTDGLYGSLNLSPSVIYSNQSSTLSWNSSGANFKWVHGQSPGYNGVNVYPAPTSGSTAVSGLAPGNYTFSFDYSTNSSYATRQSWAYLTVLGANRTVTTAVSPAGTGSTTGNGTYAEGASVTLTALPDSAHVFSNWSGDVSGASNPLTFTVGPQNYSVTANFVPKVTPVSVKYRPASRTLLKDEHAADVPALVTERP